VLVYTDKQWENFFRAIGQLEEFHRNPLYSDHATRTRNYDRVYADLAAHLEARTTEEWTTLLTENDIPCVPAYDIEQLLDDPHIQSVGLIRDMDHPSEGRVRMVGPPSRWSLTQPDIHSHPPRLGENTREILAEIGLSESEIDGMLASGAAKEAS
jgi:crotonobetainyl-CoA:carnitine CoA-transferase CaiB-like acyl-CoA transferase